MKQHKVFALGILFAMCALSMLVNGGMSIGDRLIAAMVFAVPTALCFLFWNYRRQKNKQIIREHNPERIRYSANQLSTQTVKQTTNGLFVPKPLKDK